ncbi:MAG TPA: MFS transporter [Dermatophilaceae bacterium]|nr:MFS transporter [Dermatophilaceae bacterium]
MTSPARERPSLASFWNDLPRDGKLLLSTVAIETLGTGLVLPFGFIYLHEVRGFTIETAGSLLAVPAIVGMAVVGPAGALIDRLGARRIILVGMMAQMLGNVVLAFSATPLMAALALGLLGAAGGVFWPGFNAMIGAVVPSGIRQRYFGINFTLVNLGIGIGGLMAGSIVDVQRPGTFVAIYLGNALSFLAPLAVLLGPLRKVSGKVDHPVSEDDGAPIRTSYLDILRDKAMAPVIALTFLSAFVGYAQSEAGFTAYARLVGEVSTRTIGYAFAANTATIVLLQLLVLQRIEGRRRTRVILVLAALWSVSWLMTGLSGLFPGSASAAALIIGGSAVFALGETLLQPTIPAITNDLSPDHLRGRYNAIMAGAFQLAAVTGPVVAGVMLGARFNVAFIGMLILGCAVMALIAFAVEHRIPDQANGIITPATELSRA